MYILYIIFILFGYFAGRIKGKSFLVLKLGKQEVWKMRLSSTRGKHSFRQTVDGAIYVKSFSPLV